MDSSSSTIDIERLATSGPDRRKCVWCSVTRSRMCERGRCPIRAKLGGIGTNAGVKKHRFLRFRARHIAPPALVRKTLLEEGEGGLDRLYEQAQQALTKGTKRKEAMLMAAKVPLACGKLNICGSRECMEAIPPNHTSPYCSNKCQTREQNVRQGRVVRTNDRFQDCKKMYADQRQQAIHSQNLHDIITIDRRIAAFRKLQQLRRTGKIHKYRFKGDNDTAAFHLNGNKLTVF